MATSIIVELQQAAVDEKTSVAGLLRKALVEGRG